MSQVAKKAGWAQFVSGWFRLQQRWWVRWTVNLVVIGAMYVGVSKYQTQNLVETGRKIPATTLLSVDGEPGPLVDPEADRTLVYVWAPWCGVCSAQTGTLNQAKSWFGSDVAVRSVVYDYQNRQHARRSADEKGADFPVLLGEPNLRETLNIDAYPTFYVLSKDGRVLSRTKGYTTTFGLLGRVSM